jgi:3-hydroxyisobutyrate dehydrogenase-like beta-hydroxyacid dehydrogenase
MSSVQAGDPSAAVACVVGLGPLGLALARRLTSVIGGPVLGIDIDARRRNAWEGMANAPSSASVDEASTCQHIFVAVSGEQDAVDLGRNLSTLPTVSGVYIVSTLGPVAASVFDDAGQHTSKCWPVQVTGGETGALYGRLLAIAPATLPNAAEQFLLLTVAERVLRVKSASDAALVKLLGNAMIAYQFEGLARIVDTAQHLGLDLQLLTEVIRSGSCGSPALRAMLEYPAEGLRKDLQLLGAAMPAAADPLHAPEGLRRMRSLLAEANNRLESGARP